MARSAERRDPWRRCCAGSPHRSGPCPRAPLARRFPGPDAWAVLGLTFACYTIGFNLIFGSTGQLFLCVGALAGIGGYGGAILADTLGLPMVLSIVLATIAAGLVGGLLSWIAVRRSLGVIFTGIITLIFALAFENLLLGLGGVTGASRAFPSRREQTASCDARFRPTT